MKNLLIFISFLTFSTISMSAEDGTGQGNNSADGALFNYCLSVLKAEDGTGQNKAEDGTGQNKAEDGTGQGESSSSFVIFCQELLHKN